MMGDGLKLEGVLLGIVGRENFVEYDQSAISITG